MPVSDLAPEIAVLLTAVGVLLLAMVLPQHRQALCAALAIAGLVIAGVLAVGQLDASRLTFSGTFALDGATGWARLMILAATALCVGLAPAWFRTDRRHGEFHAMLLFSAVGALAVSGAADLMQLVLGVLLSSITGYVLAAYHRDWAVSVEAGMKYFLVGALANALMVIGVVLVMGMTGTTDYGALKDSPLDQALTLSGLMLVLVGLLFKLGAVPGHAWMPDVAEAAPAPAAAFLTTVPKIAAAVALIRLVALFPPDESALRLLVAFVAVGTMTLGNLAALWQDDVRRLIGWSSVSQSGYALMAVAVVGLAPDALAALLLFLAAYAAANIAALGTVTYLRGRTALGDYAGLAKPRPFAAVALIVAFLSLVGIPPLAGFLGKFALFIVAVEGGSAWLALVAVANSVLSLFYYLRVVGPMVFGQSGGEVESLSAGSGAVMMLAAVMLVAITAAGGLLWNEFQVSMLP